MAKAAATKTKPPKTGQLTMRQSVATTSGYVPDNPRAPADYKTYREMRIHPTIALARALSIAPVLAADWSVEADEGVDSEVVDFIAEQFIPCRESFLESALFGGCDFGYQGFEKIFESDGTAIRIRKFKPLLQDLTEILIGENGDFAGFKQKDAEVPLDNALCISFRVEGTDWHGTPLLENSRLAWEGWKEANKGAERYDAKVAGAHWVIHFPVGETQNEQGALESNDKIARKMLASLESAGSIAIPTDMSAFINEADAAGRAWKIELLADNGARQPTFIARLEYLDKLMVRGLLLPERAIMEGQYGTKAEAEAHADLALSHAELQHEHVTRLVNWHAVDQVLALNYSEDARGTVRLVAGPVVDAKAIFIRKIYELVMANPSGFLEEYGRLDTAAMRELVGLPSLPDEAAASQFGTVPLPGMETAGPEAATVRQIYGDAPPGDKA